MHRLFICSRNKVIAYKNHINELFELDDREIGLFMKDVKKYLKLSKKVF